MGCAVAVIESLAIVMHQHSTLFSWFVWILVLSWSAILLLVLAFYVAVLILNALVDY